MTLLNTSTRRRRSASAGAGAATHGLRKVWEVVWLLAVPLLVAVAVNMQVGDAWGSLPALGLPTAGTLALLGAFALCVVLLRARADLLIGVLPVVAGLAAHFAFAGDWAGWIGAGVGLVIGALVLHRRQGR
ncbi:hypothetical protein ACU61A_41045 [Pseudonocardia sichuanensis]